MSLTVREAARMLQMSERSLHEHIEKGICPSRCVNGQLSLDRGELTEWAAEQGRPVSPAIRPGREPMPSLADALERGGMVHRLPGTDKASVLRHLVECMPLPADMDPDFLHSVLLAREALGSTALGEGVAVPHPRSPILLRVPRPMITLCFLETPIDFGALDGRPVHALFSMISPSIRIHLQLLSRLAFALRDPEFKECIVRQAEAGDILAAARRVDVRAAPGG